MVKLTTLELLDDCAMVLRSDAGDPYPASAVIATLEGENWDEAVAYGRVMVPAFNACFTIAEQTGSTPEAVAGAIPDFVRLYILADELCTSVDRAAEDIGGSRDALEILRGIGPLTDTIRNAICDMNEGARNLRARLQKDKTDG